MHAYINKWPYLAIEQIKHMPAYFIFLLEPNHSNTLLLSVKQFSFQNLAVFSLLSKVQFTLDNFFFSLHYNEKTSICIFY